jgi:hypothetical protein
MKQKLWITLATYLAYCIDKELYKAIDYLREQVRVLVEYQEKQDKRIRLTNSQRMRVAAKAKRLSRKMLFIQGLVQSLHRYHHAYVVFGLFDIFRLLHWYQFQCHQLNAEDIYFE